MEQDVQIASPKELDAAMQIVGPGGWLLLGASLVLLGLSLLWAAVATISTTISGGGVIAGADRAVLFVSIGDSRKVQPGMPVTLTPLLALGGGDIKGVVALVGQSPVTPASVLSRLGADAFAGSLAARGDVVQVTVRLGAGMLPRSTTTRLPCYAQILVEQVHPIRLLAP